MSMVHKALNRTGYGLRKTADALVGDEKTGLKGWLPTMGAAFVSGTKGHKVAFTKDDGEPTTFEQRVLQYMEDHPAK